MSVRRGPDLVALVDALNRHRVDYVLVGGMAALIYRASRPTEDLDILARDMDDNMERLAGALNELDATSDVAAHASIEELRAMNTRWTTTAGVVDVLVSARGPSGTTINWRTIDPTAQTIDVDGHRLRIAALEDLLVMKLSVGRRARHRGRRTTRAGLVTRVRRAVRGTSPPSDDSTLPNRRGPPNPWPIAGGRGRGAAGVRARYPDGSSENGGSAGQARRDAAHRCLLAGCGVVGVWAGVGESVSYGFGGGQASPGAALLVASLSRPAATSPIVTAPTRW